MRKWESSAAWLYYTLGVLYYAYHWLIILGIGGILLSLIPASRTLSSLGLNLGVLCIAGGVWVWLARMRKQHEVLNPLLEIIESIDTYRILGDGGYDFVISIGVKARQAGIDNYKMKFRWTGTDTNRIEAEPSTVQIIPDHTHPGPDLWEITRAQFPKPLRKGEVYEFKIKMTIRQTDRAPNPYLQKIVDDMYGSLTMKVVLPKSPDVAVKEIFLSPRSDLSIFSEDLNAPTNELAWVIRRPRLGRRYKISWRILAEPTPLRNPLPNLSTQKSLFR